jgi:DNA-binding transcriptional LysR family regulator
MELNNVDLNKLLTFQVIADAGTVTLAARRLALTRSAVSHSLRTLEAQLGISLFHRVGKALILTQQGKLLRHAMKDLRQKLDDTLEELSGLGREVRGAVRMGLFLGYSRFQLTRVVASFVERHGAAHVRLVYGPQSWLMEQLLAGKLDMALSLRPTGEPASRIRSEKLSVRPLVLAMQKQHRRVPRDFTGICKLQIVDYYQSDPLIDRWTRHHFGGRRVPAERVRVWAANTDLVLELVLSGTGAAVLPEDVARPFERKRQLAVIPGVAEPLLDHVWLNELRGARPGLAQAAFRQELVQCLAAQSRTR